jgi:F0F1-type ATP synthase membrane subunit c/vacuolar-type H+-ATPase subunit K
MLGEEFAVAAGLAGLAAGLAALVTGLGEGSLVKLGRGGGVERRVNR